jgi:hypothetical protein
MRSFLWLVLVVSCVACQSGSGGAQHSVDTYLKNMTPLERGYQQNLHAITGAIQTAHAAGTTGDWTSAANQATAAAKAAQGLAKRASAIHPPSIMRGAHADYVTSLLDTAEYDSAIAKAMSEPAQWGGRGLDLLSACMGHALDHFNTAPPGVVPRAEFRLRVTQLSPPDTQIPAWVLRIPTTAHGLPNTPAVCTSRVTGADPSSGHGIDSAQPRRPLWFGPTIGELQATIIHGPPGVGLVLYGAPNAPGRLYVATYRPLGATCVHGSCAMPPQPPPRQLLHYGKPLEMWALDNAWVTVILAPHPNQARLPDLSNATPTPTA